MAIWKEQATATKDPAPISPVRPAPTQSELRPDLDPSYDTPRRPMIDENKESVIAAGLTIEGKIEGAGSVRIAGNFQGDVFAGAKQRQREQAAQNRAHAGAEQASLDRIAHHEEPAERQRQPADPHHPAGADCFLEATIRLWQRWWWRLGPVN